MFLTHHFPIKSSWLSEVVVGVRWLKASKYSSNAVRGIAGVSPELVVAERVRLIVRVGALVAIDAHGAISLVVVQSGSIRAVDGNLVIVCAESVAMSIRVGKQPALKHFVH